MDIQLKRQEVPVLLLTGYLGSGKTTLLNRILSNRKGIRFAVIVNDIGEVNIDETLIEKGGIVGSTDDSLVALQNGCICCTLKMDLVAQLQELTAARRFDYIVIEASGICEPAPIAQTISSMPALAPVSGSLPYVDCIVTVVDALRMKDEFEGGSALEREDIGDEDLERLVIEQIEFCNIVLLNKAADVTPEELGKLRSIVKGINPGARVLECNYGDVDLDQLIYTGMFSFEEVATSAAWIAAIEGEEHGHEHEHGEGEALEYGIDTYVYTRRPALDLNKFDHMVATRWPSGIIRAKGLCYFSNERDKCYLFEQAGRQKTIREAGLWYATMPQDELAAMMERDRKLRQDWDPVYGDRMQKIVFIGQHLDKPALEKLMDSCLED